MRNISFILTFILIQFLNCKVQISFAADLLISEIMASNHTTKYDQSYYNFGDWIEFHNSSTSAVNLQNYYITDDRNNLRKFQIDIYFNLTPGESRIIWADGNDSYLHANFSIDSNGEFIALVDPQGNVVDSVTVGIQFPDISYGRNNDIDDTWHYYDTPTPNRNNGSGLDTHIFSSDVEFSLEPGFHTSSVLLSLSSQSPDSEIRYTLDGSFPNQQSELYNNPINITRNTTVRARTYANDYLPSPIKSNSYFIDEEPLTIPAISISTNHSYLYDDLIGIYVVGTNGRIDNCIDTAVNFNQDWERPVNFEYFTNSGEQVINQVVGAKINGGCSRNVGSKSFAIYARGKYGKSRMTFPFFANKNIPEYKNLILRNAGNDYYFAYMRDGFMQTLIADDTDIDYQSYQPARVYINGHYRGILNMREKMNEHYLVANHGVDPDRVDLIESNSIPIEGTDSSYVAMMNYLRNHDITQAEHYEFMSSQMDMSEFMDYYIAQIYFGNEDWPFHNIKCWRPQSPKGKWRWLLYDTDYGFGRWPLSDNTVHWAFMNEMDGTELGRTLALNSDFKNEFTQRFAARLSTTFKIDRVLSILDSLVNNLSEEMHLHIAELGSPWSHWYWLQNVQVMRDFATGRSSLLYQQIATKFALDGTFLLELKSANPLMGKITLHNIELDTVTTATLFRNVPVRIFAEPEEGFQFSHWTGASNSSNPLITITLSENDSLTAHFTNAQPIENVYINELSSYSGNAIHDNMGDLEDWIELYNDNSNTINLSNLYLTDSIADPFKFKLQGGRSNITIPGSNYLVLYADNDNAQGNLHLNFKLNNNGETIALVQKLNYGFHIIDSISYPKQYAGLTYGRSPEFPNRFQFLTPTPGEINTENRIENVVVNEFMAADQSVYTDNYGEYDDWIELYNKGDEPVSLGGIFLTDSLANTVRYHLPFTNSDSLTLNPGEFMVLWADNQPEQGIRHLGFKLSGNGESIGLVQPNGIDFIDFLSYENTAPDVALGYIPDGMGDIGHVSHTPGEKNKIDTIRNIYINECMAVNTSGNSDNYSERDDWIEIFNNNNFPVDIGGLFLTDSLNNPMRYKIPMVAPDSTTIQPQGYLLLWADNQPEQGVLHLGFKLSSNGEQIGLAQINGTDFIDTLTYSSIQPDATYGRIPDGSSYLEYMFPTPGSSNTHSQIENILITEFVASSNSIHSDEYGEYNDWIELYNNAAHTVDIGGAYITDSLSYLTKYRIPSSAPEKTTITPGGRLILWADNQIEQGPLHVGFKLSGRGEELALVNLDGLSIIDSVAFPDQYSNFSYGRKYDTLTWQPMKPSFNAPNITKVITGITINEFMADNDNKVADEHSNYSDWIELYNSNTYSVDLGGCYLSDSLLHPTKYRIPSNNPEKTTIGAEDYLIVYADNNPDAGPLHTNFKLSRKGEAIVLFHYDSYSNIDSMEYPEQYKNSSFAKIEGNTNWISMPPTPLNPNNIPNYSGLVINEIMALNIYHIYDNYYEQDDWIELYNGSDTHIDIGGLFLTDSLSHNTKHRVSSLHPDSTTIPPGEFMLLWADDDNEQGIHHLNFKLSKHGEEIGLYNYDGNVIDYISYDNIYGASYGRKINGDIDWVWFNYPTPRSSNNYLNQTGNKIEVGNLSLYPNPMINIIHFQLVELDANYVHLDIFNISGDNVYSQKYFSKTTELNIEWNGSSASSGIYLYRIVVEDELITGYFVKQ